MHIDVCPKHDGPGEAGCMFCAAEYLEARVVELGRWAQSSVAAYEARSELFTDDAECAANLYDRAKQALKR